MQSAIRSRVFRAVLPSRIFILSGSKALQVSHVQFPMLPSILPSRNFILCSLGVQQIPVELPCCSRRGILIIFYRISTCNVHSSTKVSGLRIYCLFCVSKCVHIYVQKFYSAIRNNSFKRSKLVFLSIQAKIVIILTRYIENGYRFVRNRS